MIHGFLNNDLSVLDWILLALGPPLVGAAVGLFVSRTRCWPGRAVIGALAGGTAGAWVGVLLYRAISPGRDFAIFGACVLGGLLLGALPLGWLLAGPKTAAGRGGPGRGGPIDQPRPRRGMAIAGSLLLFVGLFLFGLASEPSAFIPIDENVKILGILGIFGGIGALMLGVRREGAGGMRYSA